MYEEIYRKISEEYEKTRADQEQKRLERIQGVYRNIPRIREIDEEIKRSGFLNIQMLVKDPEHAKEQNQKFKALVGVLNEERAKLLRENGVPEDFDRVQYLCRDCEDTGFIGSKRCHCYEQRLMDSIYTSSNLSNVLKGKTFDNFLLSYYSDELILDGTMTERKNAENVLKAAIRFCDQFEESKNLFFYGRTGVGKTFLTGCIANQIMQQQKTVLYTRATRLFSMYEEYRFGKHENRTELKKTLDRAYEVDLLVIDDLGTENITRPTVSFLFDLMNERLDKNRKMIFSSNFLLDELSKAYTSRFTSRIFESFEILNLQAKDIRVQKFQGK